MMEFKGTKGEWRVLRTATKQLSAAIVVDGKNIFLDASSDITIQEENANARLIAASPDMLKALQHIMDACDGNNPEHAVFYFTAQAAITKALTI